MDNEIIGKLREQVNNRIESLKKRTGLNSVIDYCSVDHLLDISYNPIIKIIDIQGTSPSINEEIDFLANEWYKYYLEYYSTKLDVLNDFVKDVETSNEHKNSISYKNQIIRLKRLVLILSPKYNVVEFGEKKENQLLEGYWVNDEGQQATKVNRLFSMDFSEVEVQIANSFKILGFEILTDNKEIDIIIRKKDLVLGVQVKITKEQLINYLLFQDLSKEYRKLYSVNNN